MTVRATVDGKRVRQLQVLLRHPAFLMTKDMGNHEFTRVFVWEDGTVRITEREGRRIGPATVKAVHLERYAGLTVVTDRGTIYAPIQDCQATWLP